MYRLRWLVACRRTEFRPKPALSAHAENRLELFRCWGSFAQGV
jgi:hypothetical protein